jgi:hypothetical protein
VKKTLQCSVWNASALTKCVVPTTIRDVWTSVLIDCAMVKQTRSITVSGVHSSSMSVHSASTNPKKTKKLKNQKTKNTKKNTVFESIKNKKQNVRYEIFGILAPGYFFLLASKVLFCIPVEPLAPIYIYI